MVYLSKLSEVTNEYLPLAKASGILSIHLAAEDNYMYPTLLKSSDLALNTIAEKFMTEMGNLRNTFDEYKQKYRIGSSIEENAQNFLKDTKIVFRVIRERMQREEKKLYPLLK